MKRVYLVRHGESESNAGLRTSAPHATRITDRGRDQADRFAYGFDQIPQLIVTSPFLRTKQTAVPFRQRFSLAGHEEWPVQEFIRLTPGHWEGTTHEERMPKINEYWERADPTYVDGEGAESFAGMLERVRNMLRLLEDERADRIVVFTHGHFMQATLWHMIFEPKAPTSESMRRFIRFADATPIDNTAMIPLTYDRHWLVGPIRPPV